MSDSKFDRDYGAYLAGDMDPAERRRFENEVLADDALAEEIYRDQALAAALRNREHGRTTVGRPAAWWRWAVPLAAAAVLVVAIRVLTPPGPIQEQAPVLRGGAGLELVAPSGVVEGVPTRFVWRAVPDAASYRFDLFDDQARLIRRVVVSDTFITTDDAPGRASWRVTALDTIGQEITGAAMTNYAVQAQD